MIIGSQDDVTSDALAAMERTADPRVREILISLVKHLHGFIREVRLTESFARPRLSSTRWASSARANFSRSSTYHT